MAKHFSKSTGTRDELSITLYLQSEINKGVSHMQVLATSLLSVHNIKYTFESICFSYLFLRQ